MINEQTSYKEPFRGKTVIVTGGANGIGQSIAIAFAAGHARVVIADIDEAAGMALERSLNDGGGDSDGGALFIRADVSEPESIHSMIARAASGSANGTIDILVNNAGIAGFKPLHELRLEEWDKVLNTNLRGAFVCSREASRFMTEGGSIINIASTRALMSEPGSEAYAASKGGMLALTHAMAMSLAEQKVSVNAILPGWIHTGDPETLRDIDHSQHPSGRVGKPEDIARACLYLGHPANRFITGQQLVIDGGMTRKMIYED